MDLSHGISIDGSGCAYVTGQTVSSDFPTENAWDNNYNGGGDVCVTKFSAAGNSLLYSTFLGGSGGDLGWDITFDGSSCAYVTGFTKSSDFPTENAWDTSYGSGLLDAFVTRFSTDGNSLLYSTFLGGSSEDRGYGIAVDVSSCAYVVGYTTSSNFPTENAWDDSYNGGGDAFAIKFCDSPSQFCCIPPSVGDLDQGGGDLGFNYDGADLSMMINGLFIDPTNGWDGICLDEADVDFSAPTRPVVDPMTVDGADLSVLIDALFIAPTHFLNNCDGTDNY